VETILHKNNVSFDKLDYSCILLEGLNAITFMSEEMELTVDYFVYQSHQDLDCFGKDIMVARTGYTGEFGYKLIGPVDSIKAIWENILPDHKDKVVGYDAFEMCHYEIKGIFWNLPYLSISNNAFEVDYHWLVDFKKDIDYVGKEALLNTKFAEASKRIIGTLADAQSAIGDDILLEGVVIGKVIDSKLSYGLGKYITMLFVDKDYAHANIPLETASGQKLTTASAPYIFPASWFAGR
jgi:aminomethyltransferase